MAHITLEKRDTYLKRWPEGNLQHNNFHICIQTQPIPDCSLCKLSQTNKVKIPHTKFYKIPILSEHTFTTICINPPSEVI